MIKKVSLINKKNNKTIILDCFMFDLTNIFHTKYSVKQINKRLFWLPILFFIIFIPIAIFFKGTIYSLIFIIVGFILLILTDFIYGNILSVLTYLVMGWTFADPHLPEVQEFIKKYKLGKYVK